MSTNAVGRIAELGRNIRLPPYYTLPLACITQKHGQTWAPLRFRAGVRGRLVKKSDRLTCCLKHPGGGHKGGASNPSRCLECHRKRSCGGIKGSEVRSERSCLFWWDRGAGRRQPAQLYKVTFPGLDCGPDVCCSLSRPSSLTGA